MSKSRTEQPTAVPSDIVITADGPKLSDSRANSDNRLAAIENRLLEISDENTTYKDLVAAQKERIDELEAGGKPVERGVELGYDPFDSYDAYHIDGMIQPELPDFPEGQILKWINPKYHDSQGMKGWEYLRWGDRYTGENGEKLSEYGISDAPHRLGEGERVDSHVRRGDICLARLDKRIADTRQRKASFKSSGLADAEERHFTRTITNPGVSSIGVGTRDNKNPDFRVVSKPPQPKS